MPAVTSPPVASYRLADPRPATDISRAATIDSMLRAGPPPSVPLIDFVTDLLDLQLADSDFELLTPNELLARADESAYSDTVARLSVQLGQQGCWLVDADLIVRETYKGYPIAIIWVCDTLVDHAAERIAYWAGRFGLATAGDLLLCVLTRDDTSTHSTAERERQLAAVLHSVDKVHWLGKGHPTAPHLTRFTDLPRDLETTRASVLCL